MENVWYYVACGLVAGSGIISILYFTYQWIDSWYPEYRDKKSKISKRRKL